ncbi:glycosyltransferase [Oryzifoliimicrobium ureilyticus]|uniref:glycosyltransferase n=1 Tax=Oryzifoliimicrobium ureilyticus TaxID=3113724 RepID=UPI0030762495
MPKVNVIYHHYPHYRRPVMHELARNGRYEYEFWGSTEPVDGIVPYTGDETIKIRELSFKIRKGFWILGGYWPAVFDRSARAIIILGNPNMLASWWMPLVAKVLGKKILFWTHGWMRPEGRIKTGIRNFYFRLADHMLVYGTRSKVLGIAAHYPAEKITTIYNSLDHQRARDLMSLISNDADGVLRPKEMFSDASLPLIICTARLIRECRFELLLEAASILSLRGRPVNVLLVGDGPERENLKAVSEELNLNLRLFGACYDETVLAQLIYHSDLTVSPGKIGLTVIHSLSYGTPAITHGDMNRQMPEAEAIIPGVTGAFFECDSAVDLARVIAEWLSVQHNRDDVRAACFKVIADKWNPENQRVLIERALDQTLGIKSD